MVSHIANDEPIQSANEDRLGRKDLAEAIATEIRQLDASRGAVVAILGPWGSGKTSLLNMIAEHLAGPPWTTVVRFNPWLFSGSGELVTRFFYELAAQIKAENRGLDNVADMLSDYGEVMAPLQSLPAVGWVFGMVRSIGEIQKRRRGGVTKRKSVLERELVKLDGRVVVFVDDIDRLDTDEIRDIFKLVRLTGNLPNVVYVLAFDRGRIEEALNEVITGRAYLEKIVQTTYDLPAMPDRLLRREVTEALTIALEDITKQYFFDSARWADIFQEIIFPLVHNMRDIRRLTASIRATVRNLDGKIELSDLLALEAVRVFLPDSFQFLTREEVRLALTTSAPSYFPPDDRREGQLAELVKGLVDQASNKEVVIALINRLFPDASRHLDRGYGSPDNRREYWRQRRVAHPALLNFYFEHVIGAEQSALYQAQRALDHVGDSDRFAQFLRRIPEDERIDVLSSMDYIIDEVPDEARLGVSVGLMALFGKDMSRPVGMFELSTDKQLTRLVSMLIRQIETDEGRNEFAKDLFGRVGNLSTRYVLIRWIGYSENDSDNPIDEETTKQLGQQLRYDLASATMDDLQDEPYLFGMLNWARETSTGEALPAVPPASDTACSIIWQARADSRSRLLTSRHIQVTPQLDWETLIGIVRSDQWVHDALVYCRNQDLDEQKLKTVELAEKYLTGWRPNRYGE